MSRVCNKCGKEFKEGQLKFRKRYPIKNENPYYCHKCYAKEGIYKIKTKMV